MKKATIIAAVLLGAAAGLLWRGHAAGSHDGPTHAPAVTVTAMDGTRIDLQSLRGRPVLVNFWAPSCRECVREIPDLKALQREYGPKGFTVVAIAMPYDPPTNVERIMRDLQFNFPVALDLTRQAAAAFGGVEAIPTSFLIAPDGRIARRIVARIEAEQLREQIAAWVGS